VGKKVLEYVHFARGVGNHALDLGERLCDAIA
jgi:hypothetical protein